MIKVLSEQANSYRIEINSFFLGLMDEYSIFDRRSSDKRSKPRWVSGGVLSIPKDLQIEEHCTFGAGGHLCNTGSFTVTMSQFPLNSKIGRFCSISTDVKFLTFRHPMDAAVMSSASFNPSREFVESYAKSLANRGIDFKFNRVATPQPQAAPIIIGHDVWVGANVRLRGGIEIGNGAIVAADSVVTKSVPPYAIIGGNPARLIKYRFSDDVIAALQESRWWDIELYELHKLNMSNPLGFAETILNKKNELARYEPRRLKLCEYFS
ncbi:CatB-related O-acetyltransferase [Pseudomonas sp. Marseille-P8916]|uniref:CatB-related O-acetyltransferase n=1 Tax=Pseudomonas sp. Marseille-P8916 TaxID=2866589 RepID=UPI001CE479D0|nr:CatB-related O-acetyltransferase [Pseudomonas sp. Marseille-P8916]